MHNPLFRKIAIGLLSILAVMALYRLLKAISIKKKRHHNANTNALKKNKRQAFIE
jgi:hypothetical protein